MRTIIFFLLLCATPAISQDKIVVRDGQGRITATIKPSSSGALVIRNNRGQIKGSITVKGGNAQIRNARGQIKK